MQKSEFYRGARRDLPGPLSDVHVLARDMLQPTLQPGGAEIPITGPAATLSRTPTRVRGAYTSAVLGELSIGDAKLSRLREAEIV
jgi:crotonobetainyl-CoA:carnitine CoA-transferase CaiB-like acyl-CoA transferase